MKRFLVKVKFASLVAALLVASMVPAYGTLTLTLDDGQNVKTITDGGVDDLYPTAGVIFWMGSLPNSIWSFNIDVGISKPAVGGQFKPEMDLSIQSAYSTGAGTLTITLTDTQFGPLGGDNGIATLAMGGANNQKSITALGQVNGSTVVQIGPLYGTPWSGTSQGNASGLAAEFSLTEKIVIEHSGAGYTMGDISLQVAAVPEPTTVIVGALLLLPLGFQCIRSWKNPKKV
jgi:hypothetical protein